LDVTSGAGVIAYVLGIAGLVIAAVVGGTNCDWNQKPNGDVHVTCVD
jgi:hypothetical protein